ncbi:MAG: Asp23/Gls24 family envelope stress response protein [Lapillicoccus sp.]
MADTTTDTSVPTPLTAHHATATSTETAVATTEATTHGKTTIADIVVSKIAGIAAREISGVHDLGGGTARVVGQLRERIPGGRTNLSQGVAVEVGERQAAVDIDIVADYGVAIGDLAEGIRHNVIAAVQRMTGLEVTEVNITVHDVYLDDEDGADGDAETAPARVQ